MPVTLAQGLEELWLDLNVLLPVFFGGLVLVHDEEILVRVVARARGPAGLRVCCVVNTTE